MGFLEVISTIRCVVALGVVSLITVFIVVLVVLLIRCGGSRTGISAVSIVFSVISCIGSM